MNPLTKSDAVAPTRSPAQRPGARGRQPSSSTLAEDGLLIARETTPAGVRFVIHSPRGPQVACGTHDEAEALVRAFAERVRVHVWRLDETGLHSAGTCKLGH